VHSHPNFFPQKINKKAGEIEEWILGEFDVIERILDA